MSHIKKENRQYPLDSGAQYTWGRANVRREITLMEDFCSKTFAKDSLINHCAL